MQPRELADWTLGRLWMHALNIRHTEFGIDPADREVLGAAGLSRFEHLMDGPVGEAVSIEPGGEVRRVTIGFHGHDRTFYLKRSREEPIRSILEAVMRLRVPQSACYRELSVIRFLQQHDVPVMKPVAWGQQRLLGLPRQGLLLLREVEGQEMTQLFARADTTMRRRLLVAIGALLGRLNRLGLFHRIRLRDLICTELSPDECGSVRLVLIDRQASRPEPRRVNLSRCSRCLGNCYCKLITMGYELSVREMLCFLGAYRQALGIRLGRSALARKTAAVVRKRTAPGAKYGQA